MIQHSALHKNHNNIIIKKKI